MSVFRTVRSFWPVFTLFCLLGASAGFWPMYLATTRAPITLTGIKEVDGLVVRNGSLDIQLSLIRSQQCDAHVERWMWQDTSMVDRFGHPIRRYVSLPQASNPPTPLGVEVTYVLALPMPSNVTPGRWYYWSRTYDNCPSLPALQVAPRESPDTPVLVLDQPVPGAVPSPEQLVPADAIQPNASRPPRPAPPVPPNPSNPGKPL